MYDSYSSLLLFFINIIRYNLVVQRKEKTEEAFHTKHELYERMWWRLQPAQWAS